jgi:hypothetical protein
MKTYLMTMIELIDYLKKRISESDDLLNSRSGYDPAYHEQVRLERKVYYEILLRLQGRI